jgi:hypothetical protein
LEKGDNVQRRKRSLEIVTDLMKRSGGKRQKAADILVEVLWPVRDSDAFSLMDEDVWLPRRMLGEYVYDEDRRRWVSIEWWSSLMPAGIARTFTPFVAERPAWWLVV